MIKDIRIDILGQSEDALQQKCIFWFHNEFPDLRGLLFAVPNGGTRNAREGQKLKRTGVVAGVSDLILLYDNYAILLEAKTETGVQSKKQKDWQEKVENQGLDYYLFRSLKEFKSIIKYVIYGE